MEAREEREAIPSLPDLLWRGAPGPLYSEARGAGSVGCLRPCPLTPDTFPFEEPYTVTTVRALSSKRAGQQA